MRVCTPHCGIDPETTSGGETYERELLQRLAARGVVFDILLARHKRYPEGVPNWNIHRLPIGRGLRWPVALVLLPPLIKRLYDAKPFDILRAHSLRFIGPAALSARRRYRLPVPVIAHHHHLDPNWLNPLIERRVMRGADRIIVGSQFSRQQAVKELGIDAGKISVVYYGVDARFTPGPKPQRLVERWGLRDHPVLLFLGGLKERKNLFFLLDVYREVARERPEARLVIAGSGPLLDPLKRAADRADLANRVVFAGYVPEAEKVECYRLADLLLFPSSMEGFGFSVGEAMSCGLPVVVSNRGSLPELVLDGEGGFLCDPEDAPAFASRALQLLSDPALREKFGSANRERVDRLFRWDHCAENTKRVYEEVLDDWKRRRAQGG
jgi:1,4-alpha-glucan branching enzyme